MTGSSTDSDIQTSLITPEEENYLRIANLLMRVAPPAVRVKFDIELDPGKLNTALGQQRFKKLQTLKKKRVINQVQWDLLFPKSGKASSKTFDLTLMICLIKHFTTIPVENVLPSTCDETEGAHLTRLKCYRNQIMHSKDGVLSDPTFNEWWNEISRAIIRLGGTSFKELCSVMKTRKLDINDILIEIKSIIGTLSPVPKGLQKIFDETVFQWETEKIVKTRAIMRLDEIIREESVAVAVGPSGCGKSTAIHYIALQLAHEQEYEIIIVDNPEEIIQLWDPEGKQVFVVEDVLGVSTFDENKAHKWIEKSNNIMKIIASGSVKLLGSCKTHIFQHRRVENIGVLSSSSCDFLSEYSLTESERHNIASCYLTKDEIEVLRTSKVFNKFDFFPVLCRLYSNNTSANLVDFFSNPNKVLNDQLNLFLIESDQTTFATLFLFVAFNNCITESLFNEESELKHILEYVSDHFDLKSKFSPQAVRNEVKKLEKSYLKKQINAYCCIHDKMFDILVCFCGEKLFDITLNVAHPDVLRDRFVIRGLMGGITNQIHVVKVPKEKEEMYFAKLKKDIKLGFAKNVFANQNLNEQSFRSNFITQIGKDTIDALSEKMLNSILMSMIDRDICDIVPFLLTNKINLNLINWDGETPLFKATSKGYTNVVKLLLEKSADPNVHARLNWLHHIEKMYPGITENSIRDNGNFQIPYSPPPRPSYKCYFTRNTQVQTRSAPGYPSYSLFYQYRNKQSAFERFESYEISPLQVAASRGYTDIVELLLSHNADQHSVTEGQKISSPLYIASNRGNKDIVRLLLQDKNNLNITDSKSQTLNMIKFSQSSLQSSLRGAVANGYYEVVKLLINYIISFEQFDAVFLKRTPIVQSNLIFYWNMVTIAISNSYDKIVKLLLDEKYSSHFRKVKGVLLLFQSICQNNTEIVKILLELNFDPNICYKKSESPLARAASLGHIQIVQLLLKHKSDPNICNSDNESPLYIAIWEGHTEIVTLLIEHNSDLNVYSDRKQSLLHIAVYRERPHIVKLLLQHKIDTNICNIYNRSPLYLATSQNQTEITKLLLMHKCDPNVCNMAHNSLLLNALSWKNMEIVTLLLEHNSDPYISDQNDESPLFKVSNMGYTDIVKVLLNCNCDPNLRNKNNESPLFAASSNGHIDIVRLLLVYNSNLNVCNTNNESILYVASFHGHFDIVELLLDNGSDSNICNVKNESPLFVASSKGHIEIVKLLIDKDCDPHLCNKNNESTLFAASSGGHTEIVQVLLDHNVNPNICNTNNESPLFVASSKGHTQTVKSLLEHNVDRNIYNTNNESPIHVAVKSDHLDIVKLLLHHKCDPNVCNMNNESPLFVASTQHRKYSALIIKLLLDYNSDPHICNKDNESPLLAATRNDNFYMVELFLRHNCDPNVCSKDNKSPLYEASRKGNIKIVKLLLDQNGNPNFGNKNNNSPLLVASYNGYTEIVKLLLDHGSDPKICNEDNESPLVVASCQGYTEIVKLLLDHGSDPNICNKDNESPLVLALSYRYTDIVKLLLDHGSNPNIWFSENETPLFVASFNGHTEIAKLLLDHGSDPNICNKDNESPLLVASSAGYTEIVKLLLDHGSDPNIRKKDNESPLSVASSNGYTEIVKLLLDHGSDSMVC